MAHFSIHGDGGSRGNPGPAGAGAIIRDALGNAVASVSEFLGRQTNNFAEYESVILALHKVADIVGAEKVAKTTVAIKMDSELVVKQMQGLYKVKHPVLKEQNARLKHIAGAFAEVSFSHVPRAQNSDADALANEAMDRGE